MSVLRFTLVQARFSGWNGSEQLEAVRELLDGLQPGYTDVVVLPELCPGLIEPIGEEARRLQTTIVAGGMRRNSDGQMINRALVFDATGSPVAEYAKCFLETTEKKEGIVEGADSQVFEVDGKRIGILICGDVGLGVEASLALHHLNVEMIVVPACIQKGARGYWRYHLVSKALDTGIPFCMVNYGGGDLSAECGGGGSMIVAPLPRAQAGRTIDEFLASKPADPNSHVIEELGADPELKTVAVNLSEYEPFRRSLARHRRHGARILMKSLEG